MKPVLVVIVLVITVYIVENSFEPEYVPIVFNPQEPVVNNKGQWYERTQIRQLVQNLVDSKNFNELELMINEARENKLQFNTGTSVLYDLYNAIPNSMTSYKDIHAFIRDWRIYNPSTNIPDVLEARAHHAKAGELRGSGYASLTSDEQFDGYEEYLSKAMRAVDAAEKKGPLDAELCRKQLELAFVVKKDKTLAWSYFGRCFEIDPGYMHTYYSMRQYLQRIWYGSDKELRQFIEQAAEDTQSIYGEGLYAMLVADHTFNTSKIFVNNGGPYSWPRSKAGFQHIFKVFGYSSYIWHVYGYSAMLAEDYAVFNEVLNEIGTSWDDEKQRHYKKQAWFYMHVKRAKKYQEG